MKMVQLYSGQFKERMNLHYVLLQTPINYTEKKT